MKKMGKGEFKRYKQLLKKVSKRIDQYIKTKAKINGNIKQKR